MIFVRFINDKSPEIVFEGSEQEIISEIHKKGLCDWHDSFFYERGKYENLGIENPDTYDYYSIYESKEKLHKHLEAIDYDNKL